jgi:hypothetical protein
LYRYVEAQESGLFAPGELLVTAVSTKVGLYKLLNSVDTLFVFQTF